MLLTCPKSQHVLTTESLTKCYQDSFAFICPTNVLNVAPNITWLGFPYNPDTKLTFPRHPVPTNDCANLHPLLHLGGRMFLSTTTNTLQLSSGRLVTAPLAVYRFPCNDTFDGMASGLGTCAAHITVTVPMASPYLLQFTPWAPVFINVSSASFRHPVLDIPPPEHLNKSVLRDLDSTFDIIDGQLTRTLTTVNNDIDRIHEEPNAVTAYIGYAALGFSIFSCIVSFILIHLFRQTTSHATRRPNGSASLIGTHACPDCHRPRPTILHSGSAPQLEAEHL